MRIHLGSALALANNGVAINLMQDGTWTDCSRDRGTARRWQEKQESDQIDRSIDR